MKKQYAYIVMMNWNPMGGADWRPERVFLYRTDAVKHIKEMWKDEWLDMPIGDIPIEKAEWLYIEKVGLG